MGEFDDGSEHGEYVGPKLHIKDGRIVNEFGLEALSDELRKVTVVVRGADGEGRRYVECGNCGKETTISNHDEDLQDGAGADGGQQPGADRADECTCGECGVSWLRAAQEEDRGEVLDRLMPGLVQVDYDRVASLFEQRGDSETDDGWGRLDGDDDEDDYEQDDDDRR